MSLASVQAALAPLGLADRVITFDSSSATVALAARALGVPPGCIAKSLAFQKNETEWFLVLTAGDARIHNAAFKAAFGCKAKLLSPALVEQKTGHPVGGVCPFALREAAPVYLDESLRAYATLYPAAGTPSSAVRLSLEELEAASGAVGYVSVTRPPTA